MGISIRVKPSQKIKVEINVHHFCQPCLDSPLFALYTAIETGQPVGKNSDRFVDPRLMPTNVEQQIPKRARNSSVLDCRTRMHANLRKTMLANGHQMAHSAFRSSEETEHEKKENIILQVRGRNPPEVLMSIELFLVLLSPSWSYKMSIAADSPLSPP